MWRERAHELDKTAHLPLPELLVIGPDDRLIVSQRNLPFVLLDLFQQATLLQSEKLPPNRFAWNPGQLRNPGKRGWRGPWDVLILVRDTAAFFPQMISGNEDENEKLVEIALEDLAKVDELGDQKFDEFVLKRDVIALNDRIREIPVFFGHGRTSSANLKHSLEKAIRHTPNGGARKADASA
jgi:hypothetical protein